jgi:hypothetical protein
MASIYDKASLVLIPSGTKTSKVYSQKPVNGDGDFTFSRSTAATRVNADGNIEKETQNLLLQSNNFDTTWTPVNISVTGGQSGYDGSNNAWSITPSETDTSCRIMQSVSTSGLQTFSVYAKANGGNGLVLRTDDSSVRAWFDLSNGTANSIGPSTISQSIEDIGNDWYRCSMTFSQSVLSIRFYVSDVAGNYNCTSGNGILVQDAQLEQGLVARDVITTTTAAVEGGITDNVPRLDYTDSSCPALLLEPQRRNLVRHSEYIGGLEVGHTPTISIESVTNPEGYSFAYKVVAVSTSSRVQDNIGTQGNNMVFSGFFKGTGTATRLRFRNNQGAQVQYNIDSSGDFSLQFEDAANDNYGIEDYGNGWHRIYFETTTASGGTDNYIQVYPDSENGTGSVYVWGLQVEDNGAGGGTSYATSYIPTYGTSVTRGEGLGLIEDLQSNGIIGNDVTIFIDATLNADSGNAGIWILGNASFDAVRQTGSAITLTEGGSSTATAFFDSGNAVIKFAFKLGGSSFKAFKNGNATPVIDTTFTLTTPFDLFRVTGKNAGNIWRKILIFPEALSDAECIALTTL